MTALDVHGQVPFAAERFAANVATVRILENIEFIRQVLQLLESYKDIKFISQVLQMLES